jgi:hypothetical protein
MYISHCDNTKFHRPPESDAHFYQNISNILRVITSNYNNDNNINYFVSS